MVSPKFSVIELPSLMLCSCYRQLIAIEKIYLADYNTLPLYLFNYLISLSVTVLNYSFLSLSCYSYSEWILSSTNLVYTDGITSSSSSLLGALVTRKASTRSYVYLFCYCSVFCNDLERISCSKVVTESCKPL